MFVPRSKDNKATHQTLFSGKTTDILEHQQISSIGGILQILHVPSSTCLDKMGTV